MRTVFSIVIPGLALAACAAPSGSDPAPASTTQPIIKGEDSPTGPEDSVVLLVHANRSQFAACTGTLVAPNLILTALHCVSRTDQSAACDEEGNALAGGDVGRLHSAEDIYVFTGNERPNFFGGERPPVAANGTKIFAPDSDTLCNNDIALIVLDKNVEGAVIAPLRLDQPAVAGETVTSVGWGVTDRTPSPDTRKRRLEVAVTGVGPFADRRQALGPSEFGVGESICSGDSGGPAFASETGAVLGVVSRGGNGRQPSESDPSAGCEGEDASNIYTGVAGHRDLILAAFEAAGATPWLENELNPILSEFGTECTEAAECQQGVCAQTEGETTTCNLDCSQNECPEGYECTSAEDETQLCTAVVPEPVKAKKSETEAGCSTGVVGGTGAAAVSWLGLAGFAALASRRLRKARR